MLVLVLVRSVALTSDDGDCLVSDDGAGEGAVDIAVGRGVRCLVAA